MQISKEPLSIIFVSYGLFENNSGYHIAGFAEGLADRGHCVGFIAAGPYSGNKEKIATATVDQLPSGDFDPRLVEMLSNQATIIHAWTPRETVRRVVQSLISRGLRYIVHLEDDEKLITAAHLNVEAQLLEKLSESSIPDLPGHVSHPRLSEDFIKNACGITAIAESLLRDVPKQMPSYHLEPGINTEMFCPLLSAKDRLDLRSSYGVPAEAKLLVYHGNTHKNNVRDITSLYTAIRVMRQNAFNIHLIRTGEPESSRSYSTDYRIATGVLHVGFLARADIPQLLDIADMYVQPGWTTPFNARRFPSKVPEFLAMGRPLILPNVNIGRKLTDGYNAIVLRSGGAEAIISGILKIHNDDKLAQEIGHRGRTFAIGHFDWKTKIEGLERFYYNLQ